MSLKAALEYLATFCRGGLPGWLKQAFYQKFDTVTIRPVTNIGLLKRDATYGRCSMR